MTKPTHRATKSRAGKGAARAPKPPGLSEADVDVYVEENKAALDASFKRARGDYAKGIYSRRSVKDIAAAGKRQFRRRAKSQS